MGLGPVHAATPILKRHGLKLDSLDYWEINEAFAAQVLGCLAAWKDEKYCKEQLGLDSALGDLDQEKLNVDGGAVALGHPVGASGANSAGMPIPATMRISGALITTNSCALLLAFMFVNDNVLYHA